MLDIDVVSLILGERGEFGVEGWKMKGSNLLIEFLWKHINFSTLIFVCFFVLPKLNLGQNLVSEGARHHE